jgi:hypothetical protein
MAFPTVEDCLRTTGTKRNVLHGFDQLLREMLERIRLRACNLGLDDDEVGMGCVTVMMTVAADLALVASDELLNVEAKHFSRAAEDAFAWTRGRLSGREESRQSVVESVASSSSMTRAIRVAKNKLM